MPCPVMPCSATSRSTGQWRTNVFHLPVRGTGDGGAFTTVDDMHDFWPALLGGRIVSDAMVQDMVRPHSDPDEDGITYGLGLWLDPSDGSLQLVGEDAGVSFTTVHYPEQQVDLDGGGQHGGALRGRCTVLWPITYDDSLPRA